MIYILCILIIPLSFYLHSFIRRWHLTNFLEQQCGIPWYITTKLDALTVEEMAKYAKKGIEEAKHLELNEKFNKFYIKEYVLLRIASGYKNKSILILANYFQIDKEEIIEAMKELNN